MDLTGIGSLAEFAGKLLDRLSPDPTVKAQQQMELAKMQQTGELAQLAASTELIKGQLAVNTAEAANANLFVAGWRPFVGWACGAGLAYIALVEPLARFVALTYFHYTGQFPTIDTSITFQILMGMLGLGGLRSIEKVKGVA